MKDLIQIAGIIDAEEAKLVMASGAQYLGFPLRLPVHKEDLTEEQAIEVIKTIMPPFQGVLITYEHTAEDIISFCRKLHVTIVQLHGDITATELQRIKTTAPDIEIIKSLVITGSNTAELESLVNTTAPWVDVYITDTFDPATGASGATGKTHDWSISKHLIEISPKPVIIAGGLNAYNVKDAILANRPAGVDVHTGIEGPDGRKDPDLLMKFVSEANEGFRLINQM
ncbi:MAG: phosphoribosylanthranilate isomerase [Ignavibacteria bacterium]|nr:phosphoribosylanthranilate isomerase [Ignavibacteria bacterium]